MQLAVTRVAVETSGEPCPGGFWVGAPGPAPTISSVASAPGCRVLLSCPVIGLAGQLQQAGGVRLVVLCLAMNPGNSETPQ